MNRRDFLSRFLQTAAGAAVIAAGVDLDRLGWAPGEKTIFIPEAIVSPNLTELLAFDKSAFGKVFHDFEWDNYKTMPVDVASFSWDREDWQKGIAHAAKLLADEIDRQCLEHVYAAMYVPRDGVSMKLPLAIRTPMDWATRLNALGVPVDEPRVLLTDGAHGVDV